MYELIQINARDYYIESPARMGLVRLNQEEVCLIDTGNDKEAGRKVRQVLDRMGWRLRLILNTHSNADHIGGNRYLQKQFACPVYAPGVEAAFTSYPVLEPSFLYGGFPPKALRHKFLMAEPSDAMPLSEGVLPAGMEILPLPGHFFDMVGFRSPDGTAYIADSLASEASLAKHGVSFLYDVKAYLETLEALKGMAAGYFVPAHAAPCRDITALAEKNIQKVHEVEARILAACAAPRSFEEILAEIFCAYRLTMSLEQYALVGSSVRSYIAYLLDGGRLELVIDGGWIRYRNSQA